MKGGNISINISESQIKDINDDITNLGFIIDEKLKIQIKNMKPHNTLVNIVDGDKEFVKSNIYELDKQFKGKFYQRVYSYIKESVSKHIFNKEQSTEENSENMVAKYSLLRDVTLIHYLGYEKYVSICIGESKKGGFANTENRQKYKNLEHSLVEILSKMKEERLINQNYEEIIKSSGIESMLKKVIPKINKYPTKATFFHRESKDILKKVEDEVSDKVEDKKVKGAFMGYFKKIYFGLLKDNILSEKESSLKVQNELIEKSVESVWSFGLKKRKGGDPTTEQIVEYRKSRFSLFRMFKFIGIAILMIYFSCVMVESYRLLCFQIERIYEARQTYLNIFPDDEGQSEEDKNFISYIFTFFKIMHEAVAGAFIQMVDKLDTDATLETLKDIIYSSASRTTNDAFESCSDNYFGCFNGFLTGLTGDYLKDSGQQDIYDKLEIEYITKKNMFRKQLRDIRFEYSSATTNIITAINGLLFTNVLLLNTLFPKTYPNSFVFYSFSLLQSSYMSRDMLWRIGFTGSQVMLLLNPTKYLKRIEPPEHSTQVSPAIENDQDELELLRENNKIPVEEQNTTFNRLVESMDRTAHDLDAANALADLFSGRTRGGNKKSYKKRRTRKSKQTRKQRRRKTKSKK